MNIAIVGCGSIAEVHADALAVLAGSVPASGAGPEGPRLVSVYDPDAPRADALARQHHVPHVARDVGEILRDPAVDAVLVCSPSAAHAEQVERCLTAGKHVLCEIPLAMSLAGTDRLIDLAARTDRRLMVCHTERYWPGSVDIRRRVSRGTLRVHALLGRFMFLRRENVNWQGRRRGWTDDLLWHHACHAVDLALWLLDADEVEVAAQVARPGGPLGIPMDLTIALRTPRDQLVTLVLSYNTHLPVHDYLLSGEEHTLLLTETTLADEGGLVPTAAPVPPVVAQDAEFIASVREARPPAVDARSVRPAMVVLQRVQDLLDERLRVDTAGPEA